MRIAVTGAAGFLGTAIVEAACAAGHEVVAIARRAGDDAPGLTWAALDLARDTDLAAHLRGCEVVIHAAAAKQGSFEQQFVDTVTATARLVDAMREAGVRRLVGVGSFAVYDYSRIAEDTVIGEDASPEANPIARDAYTQAKLLQEVEFQRFAHDGGDVVVLRPGIVYGPGQLWPSCLGQGVGARLWLRMGPADAELPMIHVANCAEALVMAATCTAAAGQTLNLVDDERPTRGNWLARANSELPTPKTVLPFPWWLHRRVIGTLGALLYYVPVLRARLPGLVLPARLDARFKAFRYSNAKAKSVLGWQPRARLDDAFRPRSDA